MNSSSSLHKLLFSLFLAFYFSFSFAQTYTVKGIILDAKTNEALIGASVAVEGTTLGEVTGYDGRFEIAGIREQQITLNISFMGYETQRIKHNFSKDPNPDFRIKLKPSSFDLDEVVVSGRVDGQIKALIDQKKAESIKKHHLCRAD